MLTMDEFGAMMDTLALQPKDEEAEAVAQLARLREQARVLMEQTKEAEAILAACQERRAAEERRRAEEVRGGRVEGPVSFARNALRGPPGDAG